MQIPRTIRNLELLVHLLSQSNVCPLIQITFSSSNFFSVHSPHSVAENNNKRSNLQCCCGSHLESLLTYEATYKRGIPTLLYFPLFMLQNMTDIDSRKFKNWKPPNIQIKFLWNKSERGNVPVREGGSWFDFSGFQEKTGWIASCSWFSWCLWRFAPTYLLKYLNPRRQCY